MDNFGPIGRTAALLLEGWGYNLYREENRIRADDLLIRSKVGEILAQARAGLRRLETEYRRIYLPPPTRDNPFPNSQSVAQVKLIGRCDVMIEQAATAIASAAVPAEDGIRKLYHSEREVLLRLHAIDVRMVDAAVGFHDLVVELDVTSVSKPALEVDIQICLKPLHLIIKERNDQLCAMK